MEKILFVDDEPYILQSLQRQLYQRFDMHIAENGKEALRLLKERGPFAVIVSDMRMPNMNGIELLKLVKDLYPDTVRLMLTGYADRETAIEAVNTGQIFRFLTKPCPPAQFITSLVLAIRQHHLITAEQELLQNTLKGCVSVLAELLGMTSPLAFSSGLRIREYVVRIAEALRLPQPWRFEIAALLSQIGSAALPGEILSKYYTGQELTPDEAELFDSHPETAKKLLERIPRLESVTAMIALQRKQCDASTEFLKNPVGKEVLLGVQILKAATEYDRLLFQGMSRGEALAHMRKQKKIYNTKILDILATIRLTSQEHVLSLKIGQLTVGMIAEEDVLTKNGTLVVAKGQIITLPLLNGLANFSQQTGIVEPIRVRVGRFGETHCT